MKTNKMFTITDTYLSLPEDFKGTAIDALKLLVEKLESSPDALIYEDNSTSEFNYKEFIQGEREYLVSYGITSLVSNEKGNIVTDGYRLVEE